MKMKRFLALFLALAMALTLAACGGSSGGGSTNDGGSGGSSGGQDDSQQNQTDGSGDQTSITFATYPVGDMTKESVINALIADFNAVHPEIKVNVQYLDYTNGDDTVNTAIEANNAPDIIFEGPERLIANWGAKGYMVDLKDLVASGTYDATLSSCTNAAGAVYELPVCQTVHCMGINYDAFEKAGALQYIDTEKHTWTTEGFINAVNALSADGWSPAGAVFCSGQGGDQGTRALVTNMYGGTFANQEHTEYTAFSPENVQALETLRDLEGIAFDSSIAGGEELALFCNGTFAIASCWNVAQEKSETAGQTAQFDIFPMAFPTASGDPVLQGGIWGFGVFDNGDQARIDAAKTFIQFMIGDDAQYQKLVEATSYWPTREIAGMYEGDEIMTEYGLLVPYMGDYYQVTKGWTEARTAWWNMLQNIGNGADVSAELENFQNTANAAAAAA